MAESLDTPIIVPEQVADKYQITNLQLQFYRNGGEWTSCAEIVNGRIGYGDGKDFTKVAPLIATFTDAELIPVLGQKVAVLPENFDKDNPEHIASLEPTYLWRAMLDLIHVQLENAGKI